MVVSATGPGADLHHIDVTVAGYGCAQNGNLYYVFRLDRDFAELHGLEEIFCHQGVCISYDTSLLTTSYESQRRNVGLLPGWKTGSLNAAQEWEQQRLRLALFQMEKIRKVSETLKKQSKKQRDVVICNLADVQKGSPAEEFLALESRSFSRKVSDWKKRLGTTEKIVEKIGLTSQLQEMHRTLRADEENNLRRRIRKSGK